MRPDLAT
jgi:hypothetical protein